MSAAVITRIFEFEGRSLEAIFDADFADSLERWTWYARGHTGRGGVYIQRKSRAKINGRACCRSHLAHRQIMGCVHGDGLVVDHINGNTLDNRAANLRIVTTQQSSWNRAPLSNTGYFGVSWNKRGYFTAGIRQDGASHYIGTFYDPHVAAEEVNKKLIEMRGEYARLNVIPDQFKPKTKAA